MLQSVCRYPSIRYLFPEAVAQRCKKVVLGNFAKMRGKHLCQRLFFDKAAGLSLQLYQKTVSSTGVFF